MAQFDQGGGCACGLQKVCDCRHAQTNIQGAIMVDGMGIQGVPAPEYVAANDNWRGLEGLEVDLEFTPTFVDLDLINETFAPLEQLPTPRQPVVHDGEGYMPRLGDFICLYGGTKFWPHDPRPSEVNIRAIAHSLSMKCRYGGHCRRSYSVGEHSVLIARWLRGRHDAKTALIGLLHDAPEALSGFGDVQRPVKPLFVTELEQRIWEGAIAPHFNLPKRMPKAVHDADRRITADELVNLDPMDWHSQYTDPLGVPLMYWSPAEAEAEFMATFDALSEQVAIARSAQTLEVA